MGHSRLVADRMFLDLRALVLSLKFWRLSVENKRRDDAVALIESIKNDVKKINRAPHSIESFEVVYHGHDDLRSINEILQLIERNRIEEASLKIDKISNKLGAESRENFASTTSYQEVRALGF